MEYRNFTGLFDYFESIFKSVDGIYQAFKLFLDTPVPMPSIVLQALGIPQFSPIHIIFGVSLVLGAIIGFIITASLIRSAKDIINIFN